MDILDFVLHLDDQLASLITFFGPLIYVVLFLIVFAETGLVVTPFLPGDSLLFAAGALAGGGFLNIWGTYVTLLGAAIAGDTVNYWIGHRLGPRVFSKTDSRFLNPSYLEKTRRFYDRHGGKTIVLARFLPILRTFAPFVAGVGSMRYPTFLFYNLVGGFVWVTSLTLAGYFFGGLPVVKDNFEYVIVGIIVISLAPMAAEYLKHRRRSRKTPSPSDARSDAGRPPL